MNAVKQGSTEYIGTARVAKILSRDARAVPKIAAAAGIRISVVPGLAVKYNRQDVEALAARMYQVAGDPGPAVLEPQGTAV